MAAHPYGYGTARADLATLERKYGGPMHPEYRRRLFAWLAATAGRIGIGSAWRPTPDPVSAASRAGRSFHQTQRFADGFRGIAAVDLVALNPGKVHRSPTWDEVPRQGSAEARRWGLHANVSGEPWHLQPIELDGFGSWERAGRPAPHAGYAIPGGGTDFGPTEDRTPPPSLRFDPIHGAYSLWPLNTNKPTVKIGSNGDAVRYVQAVIHRNYRTHWRTLEVDGRFGHQTDAAVEWFQRWHGLQVDGIVGPATWAVVDQVARS